MAEAGERPSKSHLKHREKLASGGSSKASFKVTRKQSVKNPSSHKPRAKLKPAALARWSYIETEDDNASLGNVEESNVKARSALFEAASHIDNNHLKKKQVKAGAVLNKPKLLPKPAKLKAEQKLPSSDIKENCADMLTNHATVRMFSNQNPKPVARPRKLTTGGVEGSGSLTSSDIPSASNSSNDHSILHAKCSFPVKSNPPEKPLVPRKPRVNAQHLPISKNDDIGTGAKPKMNIAPRKLRGTFLRGIETALMGDTKPLDSFRRRSEDIQAVNQVEEDSGSESYDDIEFLPSEIGGSDEAGWVDVFSTLTEAPKEPVTVPKPVAALRRKSGNRHSDKVLRRKKIHSKQRFKSDPDPIRASETYDDVVSRPVSSMSKQESGWETASSQSDDGYEEIDPNSQPQSNVMQSSENISLPIAKSPSSSGILNMVKHNMGKTVVKAKSKFFTTKQQSLDNVCHSPALSSSPVGSPKLMVKDISPPIPEKGVFVPGDFLSQSPNMNSSVSEPDFHVRRSKDVSKQRTRPLSEDLPNYPPPPRPLSNMNTLEEDLPPVPPRGASREDSEKQQSEVKPKHNLRSMQTMESMTRCESLEDIDSSKPRYSQVQDIYIDLPTDGAHDVDDTYIEIDTHTRVLRKQSTTESENYIDWTEVESSNMCDVKDRTASNASSNSEPNYLEFSNEIEEERSNMINRKQRFQSRFMKFEPLYQEYTKDVIARSSWDRKGNNSMDVEEDEVYHDVGQPSNGEEGVNETIIEKHTSTVSSCSSSTAGFRQEFFHKTGTGMRTLWCEMPEVIDSGLLDFVNPQEKKVQEAMFEVITSEASYLKSLNVLVDNFMMSQEFASEHSLKCVVDRRSKHCLFSNLLAVRDVSEKLLADLEMRWQESTDFLLQNVCDIMYKHASESFECYIKYCSNQVYQERTLKELMKNQEFEEARLRLEANKECQGLNMTSFLLLPMQRITRLPLLIDAICHRLDPEKELQRYQSAIDALVVLKKIVKQCNDGAKQMEQTEEMCLIDRQLVFKDPVKRIGLISANRHLVKRGELNRIQNDSRRPFSKAKATKQLVYLFLFTDLLLVAKKKSEDLFSVVDYAKRSSLLVEPINDVANEPRLKLGVPSKCDHLFIVVLLENYEGKSTELILSCESPSDRARWMEAITPPVQSNPDEKVYESWDCPQVQVIHPYTAQQPDELTLEESDVINVLRKIGDGWYEGERLRDGQKGWFPVDYTSEIKNSHVRNRNLRQRYRLLAAASKAIVLEVPLSKPKHAGVI